MLLTFTVFVYACGLGFLYWLFYNFGYSKLNITILFILTGFLVLFTIAVLFKVREDASILTNALVFLYFLFLTCSAMSNSPDT